MTCHHVVSQRLEGQGIKQSIHQFYKKFFHLSQSVYYTIEKKQILELR